MSRSRRTTVGKKEYGGLRTDQAKRLKELEKENARLKRLLADAELDKAILTGGRLGKLLSPAKRRQCGGACSRCSGPQLRDRNAGRVAVLGPVAVARSGAAGMFRVTNRDLMKRIVELATEYGRYGYRRVTALLRGEGWQVNHKRVERIWRQEGLKVPQKQPKRRRLWLADGSCVRLRPTSPESRLELRLRRGSNGRWSSRFGC